MSTELKLTKKVIKVSYDDKEYLVAKPSSKQIKDFVAKDDKGIESTIELLDLLGLPAAIAWDIDGDSLLEIIQAVMPKAPEKKS